MSLELGPVARPSDISVNIVQRWNNMGRCKPKIPRNRVQVLLRPRQILRALTWARTCASAVRSRRLIA